MCGAVNTAHVLVSNAPTFLIFLDNLNHTFTMNTHLVPVKLHAYLSLTPSIHVESMNIQSECSEYVHEFLAVYKITVYYVREILSYTRSCSRVGNILFMHDIIFILQ